MPKSYSHEIKATVTTTLYEYNYQNVLIGSSDSQHQSTATYDTRTFSGGVTANYKSFRASNGYLPTLACSDTVGFYEGKDVNQKQLFADGRVYRSRVGISALSLSLTGLPAFDTSLSNLAWSKLRRKVLDQDFNAPVAMAEAGKTVDMIVNTAQRLISAYSSFRKGRLRDVARYLGLHPKVVHNTWLEYKYGWTPLLMDIHGAAKTIAKTEVVTRNLRMFRSTAKAVHRVNGVGNPVFSGAVVHEAKAWVLVRIKYSNNKVANSIGSLNPALIAWELIPFSFVADWFVNIGDCIAEATAWAGVEILDGGSSTSFLANGTVKEFNFSPWNVPLESDVYYKKYTRTPGVQTMPRLMMKSDPLDLAKLTTVAALMKSSFGKPSGVRL